MSTTADVTRQALGLGPLACGHRLIVFDLVFHGLRINLGQELSEDKLRQESVHVHREGKSCLSVLVHF